MKNKRGFTLIEIIGVIAVLAVVTAVTAPTILKTLKKSETNKYNSFLQDLYLATETLISQNPDSFPNLLEPGGTVTISVETLQTEKMIKNNLVNPKTKAVLSKSSGIRVTSGGKNAADYTFEFIESVSKKNGAAYIMEYAGSSLMNSPSNSDLEKIYYGSNPSNYLQFSGNCWSIIGFQKNTNNIKLVYEGSATKGDYCDRSKSGGKIKVLSYEAGYENNSIDQYLGRQLVLNGSGRDLQFTQADLAKIALTKFRAGNISSFEYIDLNYTNFESNLQTGSGLEERSLLERKIGLLNWSDFASLCLRSGGQLDCKSNNYLLKYYNYWLLNEQSSNRLIVSPTGKAINAYETLQYAVRPVIYLKSDVEITGLGSSSAPFVVR